MNEYSRIVINNAHKILIALIIILVHSASLKARPQSQTYALRQGLLEFQTGNYQKALEIFEQLSIIKPHNPFAEAGLFLKAKTLVRLERMDEAESAVADFRKYFPISQYGDHIGLLEAEILYARRQDFRAYEKLFNILEKSDDDALKKYINEKLKLLLQGMNNYQLLYLQHNLNDFGQRYIYELFAGDANDGKIVVLYTSSDSIASLILSGMKVGLQLYHQESGNDYPQLQPINLEGSELNQYLEIKSLRSEPIVSIISLSKGSPVLIHSIAGSEFSVPFYILNDDTPDLWKISDNVWQLPPDQRIMGSKLARYCVGVLGLKRFITMAPLDDPRSHFVERFIAEVEELEAQVAGQEWFYSRAEDLGKNFKALRRIGFKIAFEDSIKKVVNEDTLIFNFNDELPFPDSIKIEIDSLTFTIKIDSLTQGLIDTLWSIHLNKQKELNRFQRVEVDSNDITLKCFDAFIFPMEKDEADMYINQYAFYNFETNLFSLARAFSPDILEKHRAHLENLKVVSWSKRIRDSEGFYRLLDHFYDIAGRPPENEEILGYDAINFILNMLFSYQESFIVDSEGIKYEGVFYDFEFPPNLRFNHCVNFFQFNGWSFIPMPESAPDSSEVELDQLFEQSR